MHSRGTAWHGKGGTVINIFFISSTPEQCAQQVGDRHVVSQCLEVAQMLCTSAHLRGEDVEGLYRPTHARHPTTLWVAQGEGERGWAARLLAELCREYQARYRRVHRCWELFGERAGQWAEDGEGRGIEDPPQVVDEDLRGPYVVEAYRRYYLRKWRAGIVRYERGRAMPPWLARMTRGDRR